MHAGYKIKDRPRTTESIREGEDMVRPDHDIFFVTLEVRGHCSVSAAGSCHMQRITRTGHSHLPSDGTWATARTLMLVVTMLYTSTFQAHLLALPLCMFVATFVKPGVCVPANVSMVRVVQEALLPCMLSI